MLIASVGGAAPTASRVGEAGCSARTRGRRWAVNGNRELITSWGAQQFRVGARRASGARTPRWTRTMGEVRFWFRGAGPGGVFARAAALCTVEQVGERLDVRRAPGFEPVPDSAKSPRNPAFVGETEGLCGSERVRKRLTERETAGSTAGSGQPSGRSTAGPFLTVALAGGLPEAGQRSGPSVPRPRSARQRRKDVGPPPARRRPTAPLEPSNPARYASRPHSRARGRRAQSRGGGAPRRTLGACSRRARLRSTAGGSRPGRLSCDREEGPLSARSTAGLSRARRRDARGVPPPVGRRPGAGAS